MIDNFEEVRRQLKELATVINTFKSEAVQLRIVEIVLAGSSLGKRDRPEEQPEVKNHARRRRKAPKPAAKGNKGDEGSPSRRRSSGAGAVATLANIYEQGFFSKPRTISDIVTHCETNLARKIKSTDISGKLGRMVRNGELTRSKNSDGQYEYKKA